MDTDNAVLSYAVSDSLGHSCCQFLNSASCIYAVKDFFFEVVLFMDFRLPCFNLYWAYVSQLYPSWSKLFWIQI